MSAKNTSYLGFDGFITLLFSTLVIALTFSLSFFFVLFRVYSAATKDYKNNLPFDLIIVHGVKLNNNVINNDYTLRLNKALILQKPHPIKVLLLGGLVGSNIISESEAGKQYLINKGMPIEHIIIEPHSRHTLENLSEARNMIKILEFEQCGLLSNRYHLARISALAKGMKINFSLIPAENAMFFNFESLLKLSMEAVYLHWYYSGKLLSYATGNSHSINRIS